MTDRWTKADRRPAAPGWSLSARISDQDKGRERYKETGETEREREDRRGGEWKNLSFSSNDRSNQLMRLFNEIQMMREKQK